MTQGTTQLPAQAASYTTKEQPETLSRSPLPPLPPLMRNIFASCTRTGAQSRNFCSCFGHWANLGFCCRDGGRSCTH
jgi:hypothetical protein